MHIRSIALNSESFPHAAGYPFCLPVLQNTSEITFNSNISFFVGENGSGKSTLLRAITHRCGVHIWAEKSTSRCDRNMHADDLYKYLDVQWEKQKLIPGTFFSSVTWQHMTTMIEEWALTDPKLLDYFGGKSLLSQSHGESFMSFFRSRFAIEGIYFLDEPESALSPRKQLEFLALLQELISDNHAQFFIATHSPIHMSCRGATIYSFDEETVRAVSYADTTHFRMYRGFLLQQS